MSSLLSAELAATCNALGYFDAKTNKYYGDSNTLETVKDLIRYLRRDDESHDTRRQLGETKVLQTDLLPLLKSYWEETDLFDVLLRLVVNLTTPALMLWNEEIPTEKTTRNHYLQIEEHLQSYKEAFADEAVWAVLSTRLSKILEIDYAERGDENSLIIERILILIRNILYVAADPMTEKRTDNDANLHDQVLYALHQSGMLDIILYITSSANEQAYYMHILEILSFMFREQKASELANAALQRSQTEKIRDEAELLSIRHKETTQRQQKAKKYAGTRHSRFGGTFVVKSMKSISDNDIIYHKPLDKVEALNFDSTKKKPKTPKNRLPLQDSTCDRRSAFSIRLFLKEFCIEFLNGAYNTLMYHVKDNLARAKSQAHDESYYLWALRFFMEFNRCYKFEVKLVSETMSVQTFHYVQQQSENYYDLISSDKKKLRLWSRRLHLALLAYRELFLTLCAMDKSSDITVRDSAKVIKSNIFYVLEYREFILTLLVTYDELKMSDGYLKDLIETQHIFIKMLEAFCGTEGTVVVQKKSRAKKKKRATQQAPRASSPVSEPNLEDQWDAAAPQLSTVLEGVVELTADVVPFDAASDVPIDDQKSDAMKNVQRKLRNGDYEGAIGLLRAAREVWPENDSFGSNNMAPEEEFLALRDIFFADLGENHSKTVETEQTQQQDYAEDDDYDDEEEEEGESRRIESDFKFKDLIKRIAHPKVVRACGLALRNFDKNTVNTNHCIVKLLHRIAFDCQMYVMVFQVSIFRSFQRVFALKDMPQHKELVKFAIYIMRQFFKVAEINKKVYMEALFWKSSRDAFDIEEGYGSYQEKSAASARAWTEQEEDELRRLFMEHQREHQDEDVVDWIVDNLIDNTKSRRAVLKKLKEMCLLVDYKKGKSQKSRPPQNWDADEETQLTELFEEYKDAMDPLSCIMDRLEVKRPKNRVIEKLLVMGLVQDRKELRKKRAKKSGDSNKKSQGNWDKSDDESLIDSSSDSDDDNADTRSNASSSQAGTRQKHPSKKKSRETQRKKKQTTPQVSASQLARQLMSAVESGLEEALDWLKESLSDAVEDFEDGDNEGIPLVPIMEYAVTAMENAEFQAILRSVGAVEPFDEQESYWRIPGHLTIETLKNHCNLIQQALDKTLTIPEEIPEVPNSVETAEIATRAESSDDEDVFEKVRNIVKEKMLKEKIEESNRSQKITKFVADNSAKKSKKRKIVAMDDSDESNDVPEPMEDDGSSNKNALDSDNEANPNTSFRKIRQIIDSDDEEVGKSQEINTEEELISNVNRNNLDSDEDEETTNTESQEANNFKRINKKILDSDSEDEENEKENVNNSNVSAANELKRIRSASGSDTDSRVSKRSRIIDSDED